MSDQSFRSMIFGSSYTPTLAQKLCAYNNAAKEQREKVLLNEDINVLTHIVHLCEEEAKRASVNRFIIINISDLYVWDTQLYNNFIYNNPRMPCPTPQEAYEICNRVATTLSGPQYGLFIERGSTDTSYTLKIQWDYLLNQEDTN